ncbi:MAG: hypothetical protein ABIJ27_00945 [Candidatus Omnitrophota bacterium]
MVKVKCGKCGEEGYSARRMIKCACGGICIDVDFDYSLQYGELKERLVGSK